MLRSILYLPRSYKKFLFVCVDCLALVVCCWLSFALRYGEWSANDFAQWPAYLLAPVIAVPFFIRLGLYRAVIRYIGYRALWTVVKALTFATLLWAVVAYLIGFDAPVPRSVMFIFWFISIVVVGGLRVFVRWTILNHFPGGERNADGQLSRVVIYGAGSAGRQIATALGHSCEFAPVAYVDDDKQLEGAEINGLRVFSADSIAGVIERFDVDAVLLAIPSATRSKRKRLVSKLNDLHIKVLTLPGIADIAGGRVSVNDVREIDIADLLGREEVQPNQSLLASCIYQQSVMITGAGGSIGSELCRQIISQRPDSVVLFEQSEFALYSIELELTKVAGSIEVVPILGSVLDSVHLKKVMRQYQINTVYHAAAYKHVPLVESNSIVGIRNNLLGTWRTAEAAVACNITNFVLISTDKAVRPTNVMGASKRFSELVLQALSKREKTKAIRFAIVRFGNVLGSSGSVIPLFKRQISEGGPVTVTDPEMTRYFMTIPEAASLVIQAGSLGCSGDVFVLDMGEPVKIKDLARQMINLTGLSVRDVKDPGGDIEILYTGLRDGEKLFEELLIGDTVERTEHPMIMHAEEVMLEWDKLSLVLNQLQEALEEYDYQAVRGLLLSTVNGYQPQHGIRDLMYVRGSETSE